MKRIITISREFGSGGRTIGRMVAEKLGYEFYDKELIEKVSLESGFAQKYIEEIGEYAPNRNFFSYAFVGRDSKGMSNNDYLWLAQRKVIMELAEKGNCVIVGRCSDYLLRDRSDCLHVFIHADLQKRADRVVQVYGESDQKPLQRVMDKDKKRKLNYRYFTDREWGCYQNYHVTLDSGEFGIEYCADLISEMARTLA